MKNYDGTETIILMNRWAELSDNIFGGLEMDITASREELKELLLSVVSNTPKFKEYIFFYVYINAMYDGKADIMEYKNIQDEKYLDIIKCAFKENTGRNFCERHRKALEKESYKVDREIVFEYGFGLNMEREEVSKLLKKALLQQDYNLKNYKESIYYWCYKNAITGRKDKKAKELIGEYERGEIINGIREIQRRPVEIMTKDTDTILLLQNANIETENELREHLYSIYNSDLNIEASISLMERYDRIIQSLPIVYETGYNDEGERRIGVDAVETYIYAKRDEAICDEGEEFLDINVLCSIFRRVFSDGRNKYADISRKYILPRIGQSDDNIRPSREDILLMTFIWYTQDYSCDYEDEEDRIEYITEFISLVKAELENVNMYELYERQPFEMFLIWCLHQKNPFSYFMRSWSMVVEEYHRR